MGYKKNTELTPEQKAKADAFLREVIALDELDEKITRESAAFADRFMQTSLYAQRATEEKWGFVMWKLVRSVATYQFTHIHKRRGLPISYSWHMLPSEVDAERMDFLSRHRRIAEDNGHVDFSITDAEFEYLSKSNQRTARPVNQSLKHIFAKAFTANREYFDTRRPVPEVELEEIPQEAMN